MEHENGSMKDKNHALCQTFSEVRTGSTERCLLSNKSKRVLILHTLYDGLCGYPVLLYFFISNYHYPRPV